MEETIHLTENAILRIRQVMEQQPGVGGLRLAVRGGGCSGLTYEVQFDAEPRPRDHVMETGGAKVFVDPKSLDYLNGMTLDYKADFMQQAFVFHNPNATHTCSCGTSFSAS